MAQYLPGNDLIALSQSSHAARVVYLLGNNFWGTRTFCFELAAESQLFPLAEVTCARLTIQGDRQKRDWRLKWVLDAFKSVQEIILIDIPDNLPDYLCFRKEAGEFRFLFTHWYED